MASLNDPVESTEVTQDSQQSRQQHLLLTLWGPEPVAMITAIKKQYPEWTVSHIRIDQADNFVDVIALSDLVPKELWEKVTILATLFALPKTVDLVPNLKYIHVFSSGIDHFNTHPILTSSTIPMTTSTGTSAPPIGEHTIMTLLSLTKQLRKQLTWQSQHHWGTKAPFMTSIGDWVGKTVGIAGYGSIGRHAARILVAMGASVHAYTSRPRDTIPSRRDANYCVPGTGDPEGIWPRRWFSGVDKEAFHDFLGSGLHALIVCLPLTVATRGVIGEEEFAVLQRTSPYLPSAVFDGDNSSTGDEVKPAGAFLVNVSRGAVVDQVALVDALKRRVIRGAALDVTDPEPLEAQSELWDLENCLVTPHTSSLGREYAERGFVVFMENLKRWNQGEKMWNLLRRERGY